MKYTGDIGSPVEHKCDLCGQTFLSEGGGVIVFLYKS